MILCSYNRHDPLSFLANSNQFRASSKQPFLVEEVVGEEVYKKNEMKENDITLFTLIDGECCFVAAPPCLH